MNISDEHISAFLDAELEPHEMAAMRAVIAQDEAVAERVEAFAAVDATLKQRYSSIDAQPLPQSVLSMIESASANAKPQKTAQVIELSRWQRTKIHAQEHFAVAASVALMLGVGVGYFASQPESGSDGAWQQVAQQLDAAPSGQMHTLTDGGALKVQLSFKNQDGAFCRQYYQQAGNDAHASENVACKHDGQWQLAARVPTAVKREGTYATASKSGAIDGVLDGMMADSPMSYDQEQSAIAKQWQGE